MNTSYYRAAPQIQGVTLHNPAWSGSPFVQAGLTSADFDLMNANGTWNTSAHPNFTNPVRRNVVRVLQRKLFPERRPRVYVGRRVRRLDLRHPHTQGRDRTGEDLQARRSRNPRRNDVQVQRGSFCGAVPAGPAPGGYCVLGPSVPVGTMLNVQEGVPSGISVSSISVEPANRLLGSDLGMGSPR